MAPSVSWVFWQASREGDSNDGTEQRKAKEAAGLASRRSSDIRRRMSYRGVALPSVKRRFRAVHVRTVSCDSLGTDVPESIDDRLFD